MLRVLSSTISEYICIFFLFSLGGSRSRSSSRSSTTSSSPSSFEDSSDSGATVTQLNDTNNNKSDLFSLQSCPIKTYLIYCRNIEIKCKPDSKLLVGWRTSMNREESRSNVNSLFKAVTRQKCNCLTTIWTQNCKRWLSTEYFKSDDNSDMKSIKKLFSVPDRPLLIHTQFDLIMTMASHTSIYALYLKKLSIYFGSVNWHRLSEGGGNSTLCSIKVSAAHCGVNLLVRTNFQLRSYMKLIT